MTLRLFVAALIATISLDAAAALRFEPYALPRRDGSTIATEVAMLTVPSRHAVPGSPAFQLAVMRLRSTAGTPGNPIVFLAGGPGNAGTAMAGSAAVQMLRSVGDVLLLDQRGTGRSTPKPTCRTTEPPSPADVYANERVTTAGIVAFARDCAAEWKAKGIDVRAFTTEESADDVEALRRALGVPKLDLVGFSYGTHLIFSILRRHEAHIGRAVLMAVEGPADTWKYPEILDMQLQRLSHLATGSDAMVQRFDRVMKQLDAKPLIVPVRLEDAGPAVDVKVSRFGLERILVQDLGDSNDFVLFPAMLQMLEAGDSSLLARYVEKRYRQMNGGLPLMSLAMDCASGASPDRLAAIERQKPGSRFRHINYPYPEVCAQLGVADLGDSFRAPVVSRVPALFISGSLDYQTPPHQAEHARWGFLDSRHLIVLNAAHEDLDTNRDVGLTVAAFLRGKDVKSGTIELPAPRFLSVEEVKATLR